MKKAYVYIILIIFVALIAFNLSPNQRRDNEKINIAGNIPLTGDLAVYGEYIRDGSMLAYKDLKVKYPDVPEINFDWQDNRGDLKSAVGIFQQQSTSKPDLYISGLKPQTAAITDLVSKNNIPHFTWILDVSINPKGKNNLRNWVSFKQESEVFLNYLKEKKPKKVYMVYANTEAAEEEYNKIIKPELIKIGLEQSNVVTESFNLDKTDFRDVALKIKTLNPDILVINGFIPHVVTMTKQFRTLGIIKDGNTLASLDMLDAAPLLSAQDLESIVVAAPDYILNQTDTIREWEKHFQVAYRRKPTYHDAYAYDMMKVILEAAKSMKSQGTSEDWIRAVRNVETSGITGSIKFNNDGSSITTMYPAEYRAGKLVPLK